MLKEVPFKSDPFVRLCSMAGADAGDSQSSEGSFSEDDAWLATETVDGITYSAGDSSINAYGEPMFGSVDYSLAGGGTVSLDTNDLGYLHDSSLNGYQMNTDGTVYPMASGAINPVYPELYVGGGAAVVRASGQALRALGPSGKIIGHPAYGGKNITPFKSGYRRFGWGRDGGPVLRYGKGNKHRNLLRLKSRK